MGSIKQFVQPSSLGREVVRFALAFAVCGAVFMSMGLQRANPDAAERQVVGVTATGGYLFRVYDDGTVEFLSLSQEVLNGKTAGWTPMAIDFSRKSANRPPLPL